MLKKYATEIKWGLLYSIFMLLWMYLEKALGWHDEKIGLHPILNMLVIIPTIAVYVIALRDKKNDDLNGVMDWKQGFVSGIIISVVVAILAPVTIYLLHTFISPDYFEKAIAQGIEHGREKASLESVYNLESAVRQGFYSSLPNGVVAGAIAALIARSKPKG